MVRRFKAFDPLRVLPWPVWREVMLCGVAMDPNFGITVSHVSQQWRAEALSERRLWSRFVVERFDHPRADFYAHTAYRAKIFAERARNEVREVSVGSSPEAFCRDCADRCETRNKACERYKHLEKVGIFFDLMLEALRPAKPYLQNLGLEGAPAMFVRRWVNWLHCDNDLGSLAALTVTTHKEQGNVLRDGLGVRGLLQSVSRSLRVLTTSDPYVALLRVAEKPPSETWSKLERLTLRYAAAQDSTSSIKHSGKRKWSGLDDTEGRIDTQPGATVRKPDLPPTIDSVWLTDDAVFPSARERQSFIEARRAEERVEVPLLHLLRSTPALTHLQVANIESFGQRRRGKNTLASRPKVALPKLRRLEELHRPRCMAFKDALVSPKLQQYAQTACVKARLVAMPAKKRRVEAF